MKKNRLFIYIILFTLLFFVGALLIIRAILPVHLDDVHPDISCEKSLLKKADYLAVIPLYNNTDIGENKEWCKQILELNKSLIMHGVYHTYNEFDEKRSEGYIQTSIDSFKECFGLEPNEFKPPQLAISKDNKELLKERFNMKVHTSFTQLFHKVYHCNDGGLFPNWVSDIL